MSDKPEESSDNRNGLSVSVNDITGNTGHVVFSGRDTTITVNTGGDASHSSATTITVGGIETTRDAYEKMEAKILEVEEAFETTDEADEETKEAANFYFQTIKKLLLSPKKPNAKILLDNAKSIARLGPFFMRGLANVFGEPLATKIIEHVGKSATEFARMLASRSST